MTALYVAATVALTLAAVELVCRWVDRNMPDPADAQPDFMPLDEWAATAALDPRDSTDLPAGDDGPPGDLLAFSDGTILRIHLLTQSGVWRITPVVAGSATLRIEQAAEGGEVNYSDTAELSGAVWVVQGVDLATVRGTK